LADDEEITVETYDRALEAVNDVKGKRTPRFSQRTKADYEAEAEDYKMLMALREAVDNGEITFYLQPQCAIKTGRIVGAEALARWIKPDGTQVPPSEFIPPLERNNFIADFDKYIWEQVCIWQRSLIDKRIEPLPVSINVSQIDIVTIDVVDTLVKLCHKHHVPTSIIKIEITESSYAEDIETIRGFVSDLKAHGFVTLMDDFGAGYSSLNVLENVNVDVLKLDMEFVSEANINSRKGITIIESIINMSKMMGLPIIVEGVEKPSQSDFLKDLGCRFAQGFLYHRPMPKEQFEKFFAWEQGLDRRGFINKMNEQFHVREFLDPNTFTDTMLNNVLGPVAFYTLDQKDLHITRFNEQFYRTIGDASMESRQDAIQNYVVKEDHPFLYKALDDAYQNTGTGGICEVRFYKSNGNVFWFRMHFFYLRNERHKKIYYGRVEDVTEARNRSIQFFEVLRETSDVSMMINLEQNTIQYVTSGNTLSQLGLPSIELDMSVELTAQNRIDDPEEKKLFTEFFKPCRLNNAYRKGLYHESISVGFRLEDKCVPVEFSTYYVTEPVQNERKVYAFAKAKE
ncbi:MAG: EAL domain-containing protein, partial [Eubacterium sp.]|nr:EAL domain-containing protein [Candidatus Colimonas fimequi]